MANIIIDAGHTSDFEREHPSQFTGVDWTTGKAAEVADILGFSRNTNDSLEHMLNKAIAVRLEKRLDAMGHVSEMVDWPDLRNSAEITKVVNYVNSHSPHMLVSIHANAQGGDNWKRLGGTASGTISLYCPGSSRGTLLAKCITTKVKELRRATGGPDNRASLVTPSKVAVLTKTRPPAALIETCFYDNIDDLHWTATHLDEIADAIASGISLYLK